MRHILTLLAGLALITPASAQPPVACPPPPGPPVIYYDPLAPGHPDGPYSYLDPVWSVNLILGAPTGIRLQRALDDRGPEPVWTIEGFVGTEGRFPIFGGGIRKNLYLCRTGWDEIVLAPGVDVFLLLNPDGKVFGDTEALPYLTADVDLVWRHHCCPCGWGELGVKLGAGVGFGERVGVLPIFAIFGGWHF